VLNARDFAPPWPGDRCSLEIAAAWMPGCLDAWMPGDAKKAANNAAYANM